MAELSPKRVLLTGQLEPKLRLRVRVDDEPPGRGAYSAPEVLRGGACSQASDAYALGVILYELLTQKRAYNDVISKGDAGSSEVLWRDVASNNKRPSFDSGAEVAALLKSIILDCWRAAPPAAQQPQPHRLVAPLHRPLEDVSGSNRRASDLAALAGR